MVESLAGAESLFGTKTSSFLVKTTTVLAIIFFITSTSLAFLSKQKSKSILDRKKDLLLKQEQSTSVEKQVEAKNSTSNNAKPEEKQVNSSAK